MNETIKKRSNVRSRNPEKRKENNGLSAETSRLRVRQFKTKYEYGVKGKGKGKKRKVNISSLSTVNAPRSVCRRGMLHAGAW
jgi:hypothetical protein